MSRKDYIATANILRGEYTLATDDQRMAVENITASLADVYAQENPRFDRKRFYIAALGRDTVRA